MSVSILWLIGGAALLALEAFGLPGVGFLFAGIAALLVGVLIETGIIAVDAVVTQWAVFFLATSLTAALMWNRLKRWRLNPSTPQYSNIVGTEATVTRSLQGDDEGEVRWSGTLMRAKLVGGSSPAPVGSTVIVREADGNILRVAPK